MFDFPSSPTLDQSYTAYGVTFRYNGYGWVVAGSTVTSGSISVGDSPPAASDNTFWFESDTGVLWLRYNDGNSSQWVAVGGPSVPVAQFLPLTGGTLTGDLILAGPPTVNLQAATKGYVDSTFFPFSGGVITGSQVTIGPTSGSPTFNLNKSASGLSNYISGMKGGLIRWTITLGDSAAESSANLGSNFAITRWNDAGAVIDSPFQINRATGIFGFGASASFAAVVPSDSSAGCVFANGNFYGGGLAWNIYYVQGGGWKYINNGFGCVIAANGGGGWDFYGAPSGTAAASATINRFVSIGFYNTAVYHGPANCSLSIGSAGGGLQYGIGIRCATDGTTAIMFSNAANATVGSIGTSGSATTYNTTSDGRLKEDFQSFDAGQIIDNLKVYDFAWKATGERAHGVVAQEAIEVYPQAITHTDDEQMEWWGVDYSQYVPLLLQEVKSLRERVAMLEGKT